MCTCIIYIVYFICMYILYLYIMQYWEEVLCRLSIPNLTSVFQTNTIVANIMFLLQNPQRILGFRESHKNLTKEIQYPSFQNKKHFHFFVHSKEGDGPLNTLQSGGDTITSSISLSLSFSLKVQHPW